MHDRYTMPKLSIPTKAALPHTHRLSPTSPEVSRTLSKLSRSELIDLALQWLSPKHIALCAPWLLQDEEDDGGPDDDALYTPAQSVEELQEIYEGLQRRKGGKREIVERIMEGDWRTGITLYQLAMADSEHLINRAASLRWSALRISRASSGGEAEDDKTEHDLPRIHAQTFLLNLKTVIAPLSKAHYYLTRIESRGATLLRIYHLESPYNSENSLQSQNARIPSSHGAKTMFILFPDGTPFVYVSHATTSALSIGLDARSLQAIVLDAMSSALSRPRSRYILKPTSLSAKSLDTLFSLRGPGRTNCAQGGWSIFVADTFGVPPLDFRKPAPIDITNPIHDQENIQPNYQSTKRHLETSPSQTKSNAPPSPTKKRRLRLAAARFGVAGLPTDTAALERIDIRIDDPFPPIPASTTQPSAQKPLPSKSTNRRGRKKRSSILDKGDVEASAEVSDENWRPDVRISFQGSHVVAGIRTLVEEGVVDGEELPGWMTGEAGVSIGVVRDGRMRAK